MFYNLAVIAQTLSLLYRDWKDAYCYEENFHKEHHHTSLQRHPERFLFFQDDFSSVFLMIFLAI